MKPLPAFASCFSVSEWHAARFHSRSGKRKRLRHRIGGGAFDAICGRLAPTPLSRCRPASEGRAEALPEAAIGVPSESATAIGSGP